MQVVSELLSNIKCHLTESFIMEILAQHCVQEKFSKSMIERALGRNISEDEYIHLEDKTAIKMVDVFKYPFFKRAIDKVNTYLPTYLPTYPPCIHAYFLATIRQVCLQQKMGY